MNVLVDVHHAGLLHSLQLLGKRLGWNVYVPKGEDWWNEWYWSFGRSTYNDDRLARQFLYDPPQYDPEFPDTLIPSVTLDEARSMDWAYVIASAQDNQNGYAMFAREMGARFVVQVGNTGQDVDWGLEPLALVSSEVAIRGKGLTYHQEMDPVPYDPKPAVQTNAASFVNCMNSMGFCFDLLEQARSLGQWVETFGIDGSMVVKPYSRLVKAMGLYGWGWHDKAQGDGFGHVIHSWAAVGRPLIGHASHYRGRMAEPFWRDMETCIDLDRHPIKEVVDIIQTMDAETHRGMREAIRAEFERQVDYEAEAEAIRAFLA